MSCLLSQNFMSTAFIDNEPAETQGVGLKVVFRERNRSKEIQNDAFTLYSPKKAETFD